MITSIDQRFKEYKGENIEKRFIQLRQISFVFFFKILLSYSFNITTQPAFVSLFMSSVTSLSGILIVNIKQISQIFLMFHLSTFNKQIPTGHYHVPFAFRRYFHKELQKTRKLNKNNDYFILSIQFMSQRVEMVAFFEGRMY